MIDRAMSDQAIKALTLTIERLNLEIKEARHSCKTYLEYAQEEQKKINSLLEQRKAVLALHGTVELELQRQTS